MSILMALALFQVHARLRCQPFGYPQLTERTG